jgi:hypothetical protein
VSFWLDGTLHQTWSKVGVQPRVDTIGQRKTGHVFGTIALEDAHFCYRFTDVFDGHTFHEFLLQTVDHYAPRKVFMIIDNGPCHWLDDEGKAWLAASSAAIELHRLPPYSPDLNAIEGVWKTTRKLATHNRYYLTTADRDNSLRATFARFVAQPELIDGQVRRFRGDDRPAT